MSSVNSKTGTSGQDESVRQAREDYRKKEAELIKKHNKEMRALSEKYVSETDRKDILHANNLRTAREKSQESLTNRDMKYKKEVEELRNMHTKQLEKLMLDNRDRLNTQVKTSRQEVKQANLGKSDRVDALHSRYQEQTAEQSKKFTETLADIREDQQATIRNTREKLSSAHEEEVERLQDDRNETVADLKTEYRTLRQNTDQRLRNQEVRHMQDKAKIQSASMDNLHRESEVHNKIQDISREGFQQSVKDLRQRMASAREKDLENHNSVTGSFKASVDDRIENQVNRLEQELSVTKKDSVLDKSEVERKAKQQVNTMRDAYQTKFDYLERARAETLRQSNEINAQNLKHMQAEADEQMMNSGRYYLTRMETENFKNRQALDTQENEFKLRQDYTAENAAQRIERIRGESDDKERKLRENFQANVETLKTSNSEEQKDLRTVLHKDKIGSLQQMKSQLQKQEVEHQRKVSEIASKYEKRIADMNEQFMREKRLRDNKEKHVVGDLRRQHANEIEAVKMKYEDQNKQTSLSHDREMKENARRNQEKLDEVLRSVKKYQT
jgi:hypothetical protein